MKNNQKSVLYSNFYKYAYRDLPGKMFQLLSCHQRMYPPESTCKPPPVFLLLLLLPITPSSFFSSSFSTIIFFFSKSIYHFIRAYFYSLLVGWMSRCLEGGAEDFLLKPVQLSDLKKLQPHLLKSLSQYPCENISSSSTNEDDESINKNNNSSCSSCSSSKISNYGVCKRKALVSADPLERRSKLKD